MAESMLSQKHSSWGLDMCDPRVSQGLYIFGDSSLQKLCTVDNIIILHVTAVDQNNFWRLVFIIALSQQA